MKDIELRRFEMFKEVRDFGTAQAVPSGAYLNDLFNTLMKIITELGSHLHSQASQHNASQSSVVSKAAARSALYEELKAISNTARIIDRDIVGVKDKFQLPYKGKDQDILNSAYAFAEAIVSYEQEFIKREMAPDFLAQLNAHIAVLETALNTRSAATKGQVTATAAINDAIERGMDTVERLDVAINNKFHNDRLVMQQWNNAKHIQRARSVTPNSSSSQPPPTQ